MLLVMLRRNTYYINIHKVVRFYLYIRRLFVELSLSHTNRRDATRKNCLVRLSATVGDSLQLG